MKFKLIHPDDEIEAIKFTGKNSDEIRELIGVKRARFDGNNRLFIGNHSSYRAVSIGEWVVLRPAGTVSSVTDEYIRHNYEETGEQ